MNEPKKLIDTPSQTAGPFLHIGCTPRITGINIFKSELGLTPYQDISDNEVINIPQPPKFSSNFILLGSF